MKSMALLIALVNGEDRSGCCSEGSFIVPGHVSREEPEGCSCTLVCPSACPSKRTL